MASDRVDPQDSRARRGPWLDPALVLLVLAVFLVDAQLPIGTTFWIFHLVPLGLAAFSWRPLLPLVVAALATVAVIVDFYVSPEGASPVLSQINRAIGCAVFWVIAGAGRQYIRGRLALVAEDWVRRGQTELAASLQGELRPEQIAARACEYLVRYTGAVVGAAWLPGESGALLRAAGHALPAEAPTRLAADEGLVGQVARDGRTLVLRDVPPGYLVVRSAAGSHAPLRLIVWPALVEGRVHGVIELGFFGEAAPDSERLLGRSSEVVAVALRSASYRERLQELLAETQRQAEELQTQQEELRVVNEELEQQGSALREAHKLQERAQVELEETNAGLEEQTTVLEQQRDELRRAQQELARTAEHLTRANQYKSEFLANMSHELRTPLNSSLILSKLLADNASGNLTKEQVKFAETIHAAGNDLLELINDVLDLARIEAGRLDVHAAPVALARVCEALRRTFEPVARSKQLTLSITVAKDAPAELTTDEGRLMQVLRNLIGNAFKFTERGEVAVRVERSGESLGFAVRDSGIGIAPEQHEVIFEAFRQADGTTNRKYGGSGLGLSISRDLARLLGGDLRVTSAPGQGSTFTLDLPLAGPPATARARAPVAAAPQARTQPARSRPSSAPPAAAPPASPTTRPPLVADDRAHLDPGRRLLLAVEDDPRFAEILVGLAHELGFQCVVAETADEGFNLAAQHRPNGVLLDLRLPDHSGLSVLERLKRRPETRHIPVHVVSASDMNQRALEMGAVGWLRKPAPREELIAAIRRLESESSPRVRRLLIVEDDAVQRDSLRRLLGGQGIEIVAVDSVAAALAQLRGATFDCAVTDLQLADGTGFDLLEQMAADADLAFPPVIVYTGRSLDEDEEQRLRRYSSAIILKGARSPERLLDEVTLFLHQIVADLPPERQSMIHGVRDREAVFEGRTVLVVEDDVRNVFALTSILEPRGIRVVIARNGREALAALEKGGKLDLVLMDIMMPEMDGLEATRRLRADRRWADLPVIALTAKAMKDDREQCIAAGANDYISKPIDVEMLLSLMRVWISR